MPENFQNQISAEDLESLFSGKKPKKKSKILVVFKYTVLFLLIAFVVFFTINYQALIKELSFWYHHEFANDSAVVEQNPSNSSSQNSTLNSNPVKIPSFSDNHILIPSISVDAPITWMVQNTPEETSEALENGTIQLLGTATPGVVGNVFITGHSSNYAWAPGRYKSVFALLDKLSIGDNIYLKYQDKVYIYKTYDQLIIKPSDTSVLDQGDKSILTLMTCSPVGTSLNRLIIKANQTYPDPKSNTSSSNFQNNNSLPNIR